MWARLEPSLHRGHGGWLSRLLPSPSRLGWAAAALAVVVAAFYAGRMSRQTPSAPGTTPTAVATTAVNTAANQNQVRERILLIDLGEHLDRSQRVLVELRDRGRRGGGLRQRAQQGRATGVGQPSLSRNGRRDGRLLRRRSARPAGACARGSRGELTEFVRSESWTTSGGGSNRAACSSKCESCLRISWSGVEPRCGKRASVRRFDFIRAPNARCCAAGCLRGPQRAVQRRVGVPIEEACS